ncbi:hypothetical protein ACFZDJ_54335 [Streptomyces sp. NPDC007896]|uniref:hypothetical protein n=1 Tax=Streptomyces sp. NPDC007896 TaxID=3364784 RepID=UPI0036EFA637
MRPAQTSDPIEPEVLGSAAEANRFAREYSVVHSPAQASGEEPPATDGLPSAAGAAARGGAGVGG